VVLNAVQVLDLAKRERMGAQRMGARRIQAGNARSTTNAA
jgi:hypothetical protein